MSKISSNRLGRALSIILLASVLPATNLMVSTASATGIPLTACEKKEGTVPPSNGELDRCGDFYYEFAGKTLFFQGGFKRLEKLPSGKDVWMRWTTLFVEESPDNWVNLGIVPTPRFSDTQKGLMTNIVSATDGIYLGGYTYRKYTEVSGPITNDLYQYRSLKIDSNNRVSEVTFPSISGANKYPGIPFSSGNQNIVFWQKPIGDLNFLVTSKNRQNLKSDFYRHDVAAKTVNRLSELSKFLNLNPTVDGESSIIGDFKDFALVRGAKGAYKLSNDGKFTKIESITDDGGPRSSTKTNDGIVIYSAKRKSVTFLRNDGSIKECSVLGNGGPLSQSIWIGDSYLKDAEDSNSVEFPFWLIGVGPKMETNKPLVSESQSLVPGMRRSVIISPNCSRRFNDLGDDEAANDKYFQEISQSKVNFSTGDGTPAPKVNPLPSKLKSKALAALQNKMNQVRNLELPGTDANAKLTLTAPEDYLFDKILGFSFGSLFGEECTLNESTVRSVISDNFFGKNSGSMVVDANFFGVACPFNEGGRFYLSLHYSPKSNQ